MVKIVKVILGSLFIFISTILYSVKYLSAAIMGINSTSWGKADFVQTLSYTPNSLNIAIYISFISGVTLIIWYIIDYFNKNKKLDL